MNNVELLFKDKAIQRAGSYVYKKEVAIDFIKECKKLGIEIFGIDAFIIGQNFTEPSMANSVDYTASPYLQSKPENSWDMAISFLEKRDDIYCFEIVTSDG